MREVKHRTRRDDEVQEFKHHRGRRCRKTSGKSREGARNQAPPRTEVREVKHRRERTRSGPPSDGTCRHPLVSRGAEAKDDNTARRSSTLSCQQARNYAATTSYQGARSPRPTAPTRIETRPTPTLSSLHARNYAATTSYQGARNPTPTSRTLTRNGSTRELTLEGKHPSGPRPLTTTSPARTPR